LAAARGAGHVQLERAPAHPGGHRGPRPGRRAPRGPRAPAPRPRAGRAAGRRARAAARLTARAHGTPLAAPPGTACPRATAASVAGAAFSRANPLSALRRLYTVYVVAGATGGS